MTMQSSGSVSAAQIQTELAESGSFSLSGASSRWLSDQSSGSVTMPTHFYGKTAFKFLYADQESSTRTSHSFSSVDLGSAFTGRSIIILVALFEKPTSHSGAIDLTNVSLGGAAPTKGSTLGGTPAYWGGTSSTDFMAVIPARWQSISGTSHTFSFNTAVATRARIHVYSLANHDMEPAYDSALDSGSPGEKTQLDCNLDIPSNGVVFTAAMRLGTTGGVLTASGGIDLQSDSIEVAAKYRLHWGFATQTVAGTNKLVRYTPSGTPAMVMGTSSFSV